MATNDVKHHTAVRLSVTDYESLLNLADYWGCSQSEAIRTAIRFADALAKQRGYATLIRAARQ